MTRWLCISLLLFLAAASPASAASLLRGGGNESANCPVGTPSPAGSQIIYNSLANSCVLHDAFGDTFQFLSSNNYSPSIYGVMNVNNSEEGHPSLALNINAVGNPIVQLPCYVLPSPFTATGPSPIWVSWGSNNVYYATPSSSPAAAFGHNITQGTSGSGIPTGNPGDQLSLDTLAAGIPIWRAAIALGTVNSDERLTLASGSKVGCIIALGNAIIYYSTNNFTAPGDSFILDGPGAVSFAKDTATGSFRGINFTSMTRWQIGSVTNGGPIINDNDMGLLTNNTGPTATGNTHSNTTIDNLAIVTSGSGIPTTVAGVGGWVGDATTAGAGTVNGMTIHDTSSCIPANTRLTVVASNGLSATLSQAATCTVSGDTFYVDFTSTIYNTLLDHNGSGFSASATHNAYIGDMYPGDLAKVAATGRGSYCTTAGGYQWKTRWVGGTFTNWTAAGADQLGNPNTSCIESAALELACGGNYIVGLPDSGGPQGVVLEVSEGLTNWTMGGTPNGTSIVRVGDDSNSGLGNCGEFYSPASAGYWSDTDCNHAFSISSGCQQVFKNDYFINDSHVNVDAVATGTSHGLPAGRVLVGSSIIVGGGYTTNCNVTGSLTNPCGVINNIVMDTPPNCHFNTASGITDLGGNTCFATRELAGLPPYPAQPNPP